MIRAFIGNLAASGRPQGGSTITQQIVKNLLVGDDLTYERKIREMIVASRVERTLTKTEILELYLNSVYLGRGSWGIELAARGYFGKTAKQLTLEEGALLAGLTKGPNFYSPDRHPARAQERLAYVLSRLREDGAIARVEPGRGLPPLPTMVAYERPRRDIGYHFVDQVAREAKSLAGIEAITANSYTVRSTIHPQLQRTVEEALQEGLSRYERSAGRVQFRAAEANLAQAVQRIEAAKKAGEQRPAWQQALANARLPLYDVHWTPAVVLEKPGGKKGEAWRVGLADGRSPAARGRQRNRPAQARAARCGAGAGDRSKGQVGRAGRAAGAPGGAGHGRRPGKQDRPHPGDDRRLLLSVEPAQPRHPGGAPARLRHQAARATSRRSARVCSPTPW